jgi:glycosyltransferase involved in cell wall biosynthesis
VQFLSLGRLSERKGSYDLTRRLPVASYCAHTRGLVLAGDGDVEAVRQLAAPSAIRCACCGSTRRRDRLLDDSDVRASSRAEGMPMALLEAMAAGLPAIVTPVGGIRCAYSRRWPAVEPGRIDQLSGAMVRMLAASQLAPPVGAPTRARLSTCTTRAACRTVPAHCAGGRNPGVRMSAVTSVAGYFKKHV